MPSAGVMNAVVIHCVAVFPLPVGEIVTLPFDQVAESGRMDPADEGTKPAHIAFLQVVGKVLEQLTT